MVFVNKVTFQLEIKVNCYANGTFPSFIKQICFLLDMGCDYVCISFQSKVITHNVYQTIYFCIYASFLCNQLYTDCGQVPKKSKSFLFMYCSPITSGPVVLKRNKHFVIVSIVVKITLTCLQIELRT